MQFVTNEPHARVVCCELWYQMVCILHASAFCTQPACSRFPVGVTYLSRTKSELAGSHRLMSRPDTCLDIRTHLSICGGMEHFIFRLMYVFVFRFMEVGLEGCLDMLMLCACCLFICSLKHTHVHTNIRAHPHTRTPHRCNSDDQLIVFIICL